MLVHQMRQAGCDSKCVEQFDDALSTLPDNFRRTLYPARKMITEVLGLPVTDSPEELEDRPNRQDVLVKAEVITTDAHLFVVRVFRKATSLADLIPTEAPRSPTDESPEYVLMVHSFGLEPNPSELAKFCKLLEEAFSVTFTSIVWASRKFNELKEEGRTSPPRPSSEEVKAAEILADRNCRVLAIAIKQAGGLLVGDLSRQLPESARPRTNEIRKSLEERGIVTVETVVICKKTGAQVARVPEPSSLTDFADKGLKCACGNSISEEKVDIALSVSQRGRWLIDGSHWFTILLVRNLLRFGVPLDRILVDQVSGGDELDCIADISGNIALFELKDKEFNLGNAYSFGAKIGIIEPEIPVIVTTGHVGGDAKEHFAKSRKKSRDSWTFNVRHNEQEVLYIEGISHFETGLMELISGIALKDAEKVLGDVLLKGTVSTSVVLKWLGDTFLSAKKPSSAPVRTRAPRSNAGRRAATQ